MAVIKLPHPQLTGPVQLINAGPFCLGESLFTIVVNIIIMSTVDLLRGGICQ
jgi:hypothetical protein